MSSRVKFVLTWWPLGFLATLGILWATEVAPTLARVVGFPLWIITEMAGIKGHDAALIPLLYLFSPIFYGALLFGLARLLRLVILGKDAQGR